MKPSLFLALSLFTSIEPQIAHSAETPSFAQPALGSTGASAPAEDTNCKVYRTTPVYYPIDLMRAGIAHGESRVLINVDANGTLTETLVLAYTQKSFADAAIAAVRQWRYEPARTKGEPVATVVDMTFRFEFDGVLVVERVGTPHIPQDDAPGPTYIYQPHGLRTLDTPPAPLEATQPVYARQWIDQGLRGTVIVDFYIDETGAVRMPSVNVSPHPYLAAAAAAAVREWRFPPPRHKGRPVLAHCQQVFRFEPPAADAATR